MSDMPAALAPGLRRLRRRLAIGLFLDIWPRWAVASVLVAGLFALTCRMLVPGAATLLPWLWLVPLFATLPVLIVCIRRAYRTDEVVALADWLTGGLGTWLTLYEKPDAGWAMRLPFGDPAKIPLPALRPWKKLAPLVPAMAFLAAALWLPQRVPPAQQPALAEEIAESLAATLAELKQQDLLAPEEEQKLEETIERISRSARERVDAASWEAADAAREEMAASLAEKRDAVKWAEQSLARFAAAAEASGPLDSTSEAGAAQTAELTKALEQLAKSGLLDAAPAHLQQLAKGGPLPTDARSLQELATALSAYLAETNGRIGEAARLAREFGRFDPSEFPLGDQGAALAGNRPGRGRIDRGRADAAMSWGDESLPIDRFKAEALPPGAARSPDDWAPLGVLPGTPQAAARSSAPSVARQYGASAGQTAWRRTLAPRHHSAVKKYFEK